MAGPSFKVIATYILQFRGQERTVFQVENDRDRQDAESFEDLINQEVIIDGVKYRCIGVERNPIGGTFAKGLRIGLVTEPI